MSCIQYGKLTCPRVGHRLRNRLRDCSRGQWLLTLRYELAQGRDGSPYSEVIAAA
ncbi:MAG: hypothetical protein ACRDMH_06230 [Solirubrobacterales bacterium]